MKRIYKITLCLLLIISLIASCDDSAKMQYGSITAEIENKDLRTIQPTEPEIEFASYKIHGHHTSIENQSVEKTFTDKSIRIDNLAVGDWEFTVEGFNTEGKLIAKSDVHTVTIKINGIAKERYSLDWITGTGTLSLKMEVQTSKVSEIICQLNKVGQDETLTLTMPRSDARYTSGVYSYEKGFDVPTGFYDAVITMKDDKGEQIGRSLHQSVHIYNDITSGYEFSWERLSALLPAVDTPKSNMSTEEPIPCNSVIKLSTDEEGTRIHYSYDGDNYYEYPSEGIKLENKSDLGASITIYTYATKDNLNKSEVATFNYKLAHALKSSSYSWKETSSGYDCTGTGVCSFHNSYIETEEVRATCSVVYTEPTCTVEGEGLYTATFRSNAYATQEKIGRIPKEPHDYTKEDTSEMYLKSAATCTDCAVYYKSCSVCGAKSSEAFKYGVPLGHDFTDHKCSRCNLTRAGGYVFYDCDADNESGNADGLISSECGWRYLEAAPSDIGAYVFGYYRPNDSNETVGTSNAIGKGKENTEKLVSAMDINGEAYSSSSKNTKEKYAAKKCLDYSLEVDGKVYDDWFLPSKDELNLMYENLERKGVGSFGDYDYWSSSEIHSYDAWFQRFRNGHQDFYYRGDHNSVRPVRAFLPI